MSKITVVNPHHWLDADGDIPASGPVRAKAIRVAQCIESGGLLERNQGRLTLIPCVFRPKRVACPGFLLVIKQPDDSLLALCNECRQEEFLIHSWKDTLWADGPFDGVDLSPVDPHHPNDVDEAPASSDDDAAWASAELDDELHVALGALGSSLSVAELRALIATSHHPTAVIQHLLKGGRPPSRSALETFLPLLMEAWNSTPRPDLGGRSPDQMPSPPPAKARAEPPRNAACPCGSGQKYKRCCLAKTPN